MPHLAHIKMSQADWKKSPSQYIRQPVKDQKFVTPHLTLAPAVETALKKIDALGLDISTQGKTLYLARALVDKSIFRAIEDMTPEEYNMVYSQFVKGTPPPEGTKWAITEKMNTGLLTFSMRQMTAQYNPQEVADLLKLLGDAGFNITESSVAAWVLQELAKSNSPFASLARTILPLTNDQTRWDNVLVNIPTDDLVNIPTPDQLGYNPIVDQDAPDYPSELRSQPPPNSGIVDESEELELEQNAPVTPTPGTPPTPSPSQPAPPAAPAPAMPAMPTKTKGQGAVPTSRQLQETVGNYEDLRRAVPTGVRSLEWGVSSGVRIKTKDGRGQDMAKGGMLLKNYGTMEDGILVGVSGSNKLYVRVPPELSTAEWDPATEDIRISTHHGKWKPSNY